MFISFNGSNLYNLPIEYVITKSYNISILNKKEVT